MQRRTVVGRALAAPLLSAAGLPRAVSAQQPSLPPTIAFVGGASPGGKTDTLARDVSEALREKLGRTIAVENRAGAGGNVAAQYVARSAPDGGTLLVAFTSHTLNAAIMRQVPYRPLEDFTPVALLAQLSASVLVVGPGVRERDLAGFVAAARARPDRYSFALGGVGSSLHMQTVLFRSALGLTGPKGAVPRDGAGAGGCRRRACRRDVRALGCRRPAAERREGPGACRHLPEPPALRVPGTRTRTKALRWLASR